jgi:hypothetical protein
MVTMKNAVFWDVTPCGCCRTTWQHIPEDIILYTHIVMKISLLKICHGIDSTMNSIIKCSLEQKYFLYFDNACLTCFILEVMLWTALHIPLLPDPNCWSGWNSDHVFSVYLFLDCHFNWLYDYFVTFLLLYGFCDVVGRTIMWVTNLKGCGWNCCELLQGVVLKVVYIIWNKPQKPSW